MLVSIEAVSKIFVGADIDNSHRKVKYWKGKTGKKYLSMQIPVVIIGIHNAVISKHRGWL